jgi:hypothetical protein
MANEVQASLTRELREAKAEVTCWLGAGSGEQEVSDGSRGTGVPGAAHSSGNGS